MFKLHRLEITGFKSFADHTEIVFTGNGITAVVGPNGCGKSNVSDCISWVLGEQRAKSLRGGEMKDVVFQGTRNRKPSGMAEVILHLVRDEDAFDVEEAELEDIDETLSEIDERVVDVDALEAEVIEPVEVVVAETNGHHLEANGHAEEFEVEKVQVAQVGSVQTLERTVKTKRHWRPRSFALDFAPGEAVSVTRRLYLSGESEYQLNGKTCRLRDIQDLFAGTGLSGAHYAIIEQGRIGQILSAKPADRRNLIEEAAGISKFRTRQRAAESRLESAKANLGRISDIVSEIDKQANSLRRQAGKTRRFLALQEEFRVILRDLFAAEGRHYEALIADLKAQLEAATAAERDLADKVIAEEEAVREATRIARASEESLADVRRVHAENALERDRAEREHRYQSEQIVNLNSRTEALRAEVVAITERMDLAASELERLAKEEAAESQAAAAAEGLLAEAEKICSIRAEAVAAIEEEAERVRAGLLQHTTATGRFDELARQMTLNLERLEQRHAGLLNEAARADEAVALHVADAERAVADLAAEAHKLKELQSERSEVLALTADAREQLRVSEAALRQVQERMSRSAHRLETLQELEEKRAVYAPPVQKVFAAREQIGVELHGVLADRLNVDERAEQAVETVFGDLLQSIVVASGEDARRVAAFLANDAIGRIATLVVPTPSDASPTAPAPENGATRLSDVLGAPAEILGLLGRLLPREMGARLVEVLPEHADPGETYVTFSGDLLIGGQLLISGRNAPGEKNSSLLAFKRELAGLGREVERLRDEVSDAEGAVERDRKVLIEREETTVDLQSLIIKVERGLLNLENHERGVRQEIERSRRHGQVVASEIEQTLGEIEETQKRITEAAANREKVESLRADAQSELDSVSARLSDARSALDAANLELNEKRTNAATSAERRRSVQTAHRRIENEQKELHVRLAQQNFEITETEGKIANLRGSVSEIAGRIADAGAAAERERAELAEAMEAVTKARAAADDASEVLAELNRNSADARNARAAIEIREAEALTELRNIAEKCVHELNIPLAELAASHETAEGFDLGETRQKAEDVRDRLEGFGAINMLAVEELGEAEERLLFLTSQRQDIIDSIASAEAALREIKERSRAKFRQAFEAINENFVEFFRELFGGGRGEMTLLESDDVLEAGIEVVAQPPGKRLQNILLLSGGEKAMTAIALVLAIFKYRPSPFCLLDEVDAPLDDANVGRFVGKIAEMSEKTQFIVITHNKRTMEAARALYGVTMQEPGVSKIVSVKFE